MAQVVQTEPGDLGACGELLERLVQPVRVQRAAVGQCDKAVETRPPGIAHQFPLSLQPPQIPTEHRLDSRAQFQCALAAGGFWRTIDEPFTLQVLTVSVPASRSMSSRCRPLIAPRRRPIKSARCSATSSRSPRADSRNAAICSGVNARSWPRLVAVARLAERATLAPQACCEAVPRLPAQRLRCHRVR